MIAAEIVSIEQLNETTFSFWLRPETRLDYTAGQFIELYIPHEADQRGTHRWFTLSSSPTEELIAITTRKLPTMSSFKQRLFSMKPGDIVSASQAMGDFVLPMQTTLPIIFLVRGIGATPLRSMARSLSADTTMRDITVIHSARSADDFLFQDIYGPIASEIIERVSTSDESASEVIGTVLGAHTEKPDARIYISGPEQFTEQIVHSLTQAGIKPSLLVTDYFHGYMVS